MFLYVVSCSCICSSYVFVYCPSILFNSPMCSLHVLSMCLALTFVFKSLAFPYMCLLCSSPFPSCSLKCHLCVFDGVSYFLYDPVVSLCVPAIVCFVYVCHIHVFLIRTFYMRLESRLGVAWPHIESQKYSFVSLCISSCLFSVFVYWCCFMFCLLVSPIRVFLRSLCLIVFLSLCFSFPLYVCRSFIYSFVVLSLILTFLSFFIPVFLSHNESGRRAMRARRGSRGVPPLIQT